MTLSVRTEKLVTAASEIRKTITYSDLQQHFDSCQVGNMVGWMRIMTLTAAAGLFVEKFSSEIAVVANAITLGADDAELADRVDTAPHAGTP